MQATMDELTTLLQLQQLDIELLKAKKRLDDLPQRAIILAARQKKQAIEEKREQVIKLRSAAELQVLKLENEDARLVDKQVSIQTKIDESRGDYRNVEAYTKELNGVAKRRNVLEEDLSKMGEELAKIESVYSQISNAFTEVEKQESGATESFQQEGGSLRNDIARMEVQREGLAESLPNELSTAYDQASVHAGGVAVGRLTEGRCGVCRTLIEDGRLIDLQGQAPLGVCPQCKRLLVVV